MSNRFLIAALIVATLIMTAALAPMSLLTERLARTEAFGAAGVSGAVTGRRLLHLWWALPPNFHVRDRGARLRVPDQTAREVLVRRLPSVDELDFDF